MLEQAARKAPATSVSKLAYADWLLQQNETDQAKIHVDAAFKLEPKNIEVLKLKGLIARIQKKAKEAETVFQDLLTKRAGRLLRHNQLALVLADSADEGPAEAARSSTRS